MSQFTFYEPVFVKGHRTRFESDVGLDGRAFLGARRVHLDERRAPRSGVRLRRPAGCAGPRLVRLRHDARDGGEKESAGRSRAIGSVRWRRRVGLERIRFAGVPGEDPPFRNPRAVTIFPVANEVATVGLNWYVNRWVKVQVNAIRERVDDVERSPVPDGEAFWSQSCAVPTGAVACHALRWCCSRRSAISYHLSAIGRSASAMRILSADG